MARLFVHDPVAGETLDYGALADAVLSGRLRYRPYSRSARLSEVILTFAIAVTAGRDLTLVDQDFTESELAGLRLDPRLLDQEEWLTNPCPARTLEAWVESVRTGSGPCITLFTSGSTGLPKAVSHTLATLSRGVRTGTKHAQDVWGFAYNLTHMAGVQVFLQALFNLNPQVNLFRLPRAQLLDLLREHQVTHLSATPSFYRLLLPVDTALPQVRAVTFGGERTDASLLDRLRPLFPKARFRNVYASTEAGTLFSTEGDVFSVPEDLGSRIEIRDGRLHLHRDLLGVFTACGGGASVPASQVNVERTTGSAAASLYRQTQRGGASVPASQANVERTTGSAAASLYRQTQRGGASVPASQVNVQGTAARQQPRPTDMHRTEPRPTGAGDWYDTGDVVEVVTESPLRFRIVGRDRDWVNVGGNKVNPTEVEAVLIEHPGIREARVFGRDNSILGKVLCADVVSVGPTVEEAELRRFLAGRLQAFKVPRLIRSVPRLELGRTGKLRRDE